MKLSKQGIINVVSEMSAAFEEEYGHPLFSDEALESRDIFAGSCNYFFKKSKAEYTKYKPKMGDIETILANPSRKKPNLELKKQVKGLIEEQQGVLNAAIEKQLEGYIGKWGPDFEGFVFKFSDGATVKITSAKFKAFKAVHDDTISMWLNQLEEE